MSNKGEEIFSVKELSEIYHLSPKVLPTKTDCLLYVLSRTPRGGSKHHEAVNQLAENVRKIWVAADCCPCAKSNIVNKFEREVWNVYRHFIREKCLPGKSGVQKRSHKKDVSKVKKAKIPKCSSSSRINTRSTTTHEKPDAPPAADVSGLPSDDNDDEETIQRTVTRGTGGLSSLRAIWDDEGNKLFDLMSEAKVAKSSCFDLSFYNDQKGERKLEMYLGKVTKEFVAEEKARKSREAISERNRRSALGMVGPTTSAESNDEGDEGEGDTSNNQVSDNDDDDETFDSAMVSGKSSHYSYQTRSNKGKSKMMENVVHPVKTTVRVMNKKSKSNLIEPRYLEAMALLMAEGLSASEAIRAVYIIDKVIWNQVRYLPLRLDKSYMKAYTKLKKMSSQNFVNKTYRREHNPSSEKDASCVDNMISQQVAAVENDAIESVTVVNFDEETINDSPELQKLKDRLSKIIEERKDNFENTLPDVACVRQNHHLLSVYCEGKIAEELTTKKGFIMPDGTSRQGVGDIAASLVKTGDKFRALKSVQITKGTTNNWANAIIYMLKRLAVASNQDVKDIWQSVSAIISDLCKVNKTLASEIKSLLVSTWEPGQAFCNLHFTLAVPEAIKSVLARYQSLIGADKLFPKTVGFEMNLEDKLIFIQILDCWMRLTSIRWQARSWNYYKKFTDFAEKMEVLNVGHMLHANRFGEFEERCAGGVYLLDTWLKWLGTFTDVRNQLACYLREVETLSEQCKFLWAGAAIIGIHVTVPFMSMLLDHRVTPRQLLEILPSLYSDLKSYPKSLRKLDDCGIPSLSPYFLNPFVRETSPYGVQVCSTLSNYVETVDEILMDTYLKQLTSTIGDALKRQRGDQYGFGDNPESPFLVTKNLPDEILDDSDASHTKPIENYYGNFDRELKKTGAQGFGKVGDDLVIKYARDLVDQGHKWKTKANRKKADALKVLEKEFSDKQKGLIEMGVDEVDAMELSQENKVLKCVTGCQKNGGPFMCTSKLREFIATWKGTEKQLHTALNYEIRLHKLTFTKVKKDCALFKQKGLTIAMKEKNLNSLINTQLDFTSLAEMSDLEVAIQECSASATNLEVDDTEEDKELEEGIDITQDEGEQIVVDSDIWPPKKGQFVFGLFEDGIVPAEVNEVSTNNVNIDILVRATVPNMDGSESLWKRPSLANSGCNYTLDRDSILPFHPVMIINKYSTHRVVIYEVLNIDIAEKFVTD